MSYNVGSKNCIAVLNRGYSDIKSYDSLIKRNKHIDSCLINKSINILIFHEGNIIDDHQNFIQNQTPNLTIKFINISNIGFLKNKENISFTDAHGYGLSYRHMCSFWFVDFFNVVDGYDKLLRIDEDCFINSNIDSIFLHLDNYIFVTGSVFDDHDFVTRGLNEFSLNFVHENRSLFDFKNYDAKKPCGPYTNLIAFSLTKIQNNIMFQQYKNKVNKCNLIYERRWGDLPLWGEVIYYIFGNESMMIDKNIKYFHASHGIAINS